MLVVPGVRTVTDPHAGRRREFLPAVFADELAAGDGDVLVPGRRRAIPDARGAHAGKLLSAVLAEIILRRAKGSGRQNARRQKKQDPFHHLKSPCIPEDTIPRDPPNANGAAAIGEDELAKTRKDAIM